MSTVLDEKEPLPAGHHPNTEPGQFGVKCNVVIASDFQCLYAALSKLRHVSPVFWLAPLGYAVAASWKRQGERQGIPCRSKGWGSSPRKASHARRLEGFRVETDAPGHYGVNARNVSHNLKVVGSTPTPATTSALLFLRTPTASSDINSRRGRRGLACRQTPRNCRPWLSSGW